jgi:hypothetical protein
MSEPQWDCFDMPGDNGIECRGNADFGSDCGNCPRCRQTENNVLRAMGLVEKIGAAINANNGQCPAIEEALTEALDFVMAKTPKDGKPSIKVQSVFGQLRIEMTDGVDVVSLDVTRKGIERLLDEFNTVLGMAD